MEAKRMINNILNWLQIFTCATLLIFNATARIQFKSELKDNDPVVKNDTKIEVFEVLLNTKLRVIYDNTPVKEVFQNLASKLNIFISITWQKENTEGLCDTTPITLITETPLNSLLLLEEVINQMPGNCTWQLRSGFLEVGEKKTLAMAKKQILQIYDVSDIIYAEPITFNNAPGFDFNKALQQVWDRLSGNLIERPEKELTLSRLKEKSLDLLIETIEEIIEPGQWKSQGGDWGYIKKYNDCLLIKAPDFIHRQISGYKFLIKELKEINSSHEQSRN